MRTVVGLLGVLVGCDDPMMFPPGGGGDGGLPTFDSGPIVDSRIAVIDATPLPIDANFFSGRVCLAGDPRKLNACSSSGAGGLTVRLGSATTTTAADGSFTIVGQSGAGLVWRVTGANIVSSYMQLADYEIPALAKTTYDTMRATNNVMPNPGEGAVMIQVIRNGMGLDGVTASSAPPSAWQPFYDNPNDPTGIDWNQLGGTVVGTGGDGAIWLAGLDVGSASVTVTKAATNITDPGQPIFDGGITFTTIIFP